MEKGENNEIADHCWKENHQINWDNKKVIARERNLRLYMKNQRND